MKTAKLLSLLIVFSITSALFMGCGEERGEMRDMSTMEIVQDMGLGINLGNTFEALGGDGSVSGFETAWGSPVLTEEMIKGYAECGFGVLRVPVAWSNMIQSNYTINGTDWYSARDSMFDVVQSGVDDVNDKI